MQDFHGLELWQKAHALTLRVYHETHAIPHEEVFGAKAWLRRSAVGVATAIVEGCARDSDVGFAADLKKTIVRCNELEYLILLAEDLKLLESSVCQSLSQDAVQVRKMTFGLVRKL